MSDAQTNQTNQAPPPPPPVVAVKRKAKKSRRTGNTPTQPKHISSALAPGDKVYSKRGSLKYIVKKTPRPNKSKPCSHKKRK